MKRLLPLLLVLAACNASDANLESDASSEVSESTTIGPLGTAVPGGEALSTNELIADAEMYAGKSVTVEGTVRDVCTNAGCWLTLADDQGRTVRVNVPRDENDTYVYTFPTDASGSTVRLVGMLEIETESVEDQRHYAEDGGATEAELDAITEPKQTLVLTALGAEMTESDLEVAADLDA